MGHNNPAAALSVGHHHCAARIVTAEGATPDTDDATLA
jgi:hypothetical protein